MLINFKPFISDFHPKIVARAIFATQPQSSCYFCDYSKVAISTIQPKGQAINYNQH